MSFSADWLAMRRDADLRARNSALAGRLTEWAEKRARPLTILDLGAGTGANMAATAPLLGPGQHWRLADHDPELLRRATPPYGVTHEVIAADLAGSLDPLFDPAPDLVTASAFFDLCGAVLIDQLVQKIVHSLAAFYTVLSYDGREAWAPPHRLDAAVLAAFHVDQRTDKGLGPALGPEATGYLANAFSAAGYTVETGQSDWDLSADRDAALIAGLAAGSALATEPALGPEAGAWGVTRANAETVMIGHLDLLAMPPV